MIERLAAEIEAKYAALTEEMADPEVLRDQSRYAEISKAHADLDAAYRLAVEYRTARSSLEEAETMLDEGGLDPEMKEFLLEEKETARARMEELEQEIRVAVLEKDPGTRRTPSWRCGPAPGATRRLSSLPRCSG